jgi:hypothetical protein
VLVPRARVLQASAILRLSITKNQELGSSFEEAIHPGSMHAWDMPPRSVFAQSGRGSPATQL